MFVLGLGLVTSHSPSHVPGLWYSLSPSTKSMIIQLVKWWPLPCVTAHVAHFIIVIKTYNTTIFRVFGQSIWCMIIHNAWEPHICSNLALVLVFLQHLFKSYCFIIVISKVIPTTLHWKKTCSNSPYSIIHLRANTSFYNPMQKD